MSIMLVLALLAAGPPASGVHADEQAAYDTVLAEQARSADAFFAGQPCADAKIDHLLTEPWTIKDQPNLPVWRDHIRVSGCGRTTTQNINVARVGGSQTWRMTFGLPGHSAISDMRIQQSVYQAAIAQIRPSLPPDCSGQQITDIYLGARPGDIEWHPPGAVPGPIQAGHFGVSMPPQVVSMQAQLDLNHAWLEVWPLAACGHDRTLGIIFVPGTAGGQGITLFLAVWQQIETHGQGARPKAVNAD